MQSLFTIHKVNEDVIQILGEINGFATKRHGGEMGNSYDICIQFFKEKKYYKISNGEKDGTVRNLKALEEWIQNKYDEINTKDFLEDFER
mgnify:CR=1 FL=1